MIKEHVLRSVFMDSLGLRKNESCLVLTDSVKESLARPFFEFARKACMKCDLEVIHPMSVNGQEPSREVASLMREHDVIVMLTDKSLSHTLARRKASESGSRVASMPGATEDMINRTLDIDFTELASLTGRLFDAMSGGSSVKVTTPRGTDITIGIGLGMHPDDGKLYGKGAFGNLPAGEVSFAPVSAEGTFVIDGSLPGFGRMGSPLRISVRKGRTVGIEGRDSGKLVKILDGVGPGAYHIAELGIGTNPEARVTGKVLEDEKVMGTCHIAFGNNVSYGGKNDVPLHMDGVMMKPTIRVDGKKIMDNGESLF